ncbi:hypothetical protein ACUUMC_04295 [Paenarthrobacter nitroguajacolicus]|uniref:hypothetical protein n=1 Tax=Paenarthrobacter nitroguajacolicus TaxID=211146 RepID=UPI0040559AAB
MGLIFLLLCAALLSGCTVPEDSSEPRRSTSVAEADIAKTPGVTARIGRAYDGLTPYLSVNVELSEAFTGDEAALLDHVLAQVWSQDEDAPKKYVTLGVSGPGRTAETTSAALASLGISSMKYAGSAVSLIGADLVARYGEWPGPVPTVGSPIASAGHLPDLNTIESKTARASLVSSGLIDSWK